MGELLVASPLLSCHRNVAGVEAERRCTAASDACELQRGRKEAESTGVLRSSP